MKVVINCCFGGFGLSQEAYKYIKIKWDNYGFGERYDNNRTDSKLVDCVEVLGEKANSRFSDLQIVEIPDNVKWHIEEYDGKEWVAENHRTWGKDIDTE